MFEKINLFVIGASKCGTTFLHEVLNSHPDICMSNPKEPYTFFYDDYLSRLVDASDLFDNSRRCIIYGESSPIYSETGQFPKIASRIYGYNQNAKILYIVREPFSRLRSVYRQTLSSGHWIDSKRYERYGLKMPLDFGSALFTYPPFVESTRYWSNICHYRKWFPDDNIKVIMFEDLVHDTTSTVKEILFFLNVDNNFCPEYNDLVKNSGKDKVMFNSFEWRLREILPSYVVKYIPDFFKKMARYFTSNYYSKAELSADFSKEQEALVYTLLEDEVKNIYNYIGVKGDPWGFFKK
ncbi:MAG: sulfotransferase [Oceanospirillaceae bacterium]|nr:sulfotransferase [Oceanospirillaceae bacterium]